MKKLESTVELMSRRSTSPWSLRERIWRLLWMIVEATLYRYSTRCMDCWRAYLLSCFGATIGHSVGIRRTAHVEIPWHLKMGDYASLGDHVIVYNLGQITLGKRVAVSQYAHLCAGTHDHTLLSMPLLQPPIIVEDDVWIAADAFIGPGVTIGEGVVVGARSSVFTDLPAWKICVGNPAKPIKDRKLEDR